MMDAKQPGLFDEPAGRVAVVTGGASGIGKGIAAAFRARDMQVVIADIEQGPLDAAATELGAVGIRTDVGDAASVQALADAVKARFGSADVLVNNAGVGPKGNLADVTLDDWRWLVDVNLMGVVHGLNAFLPMLRANPKGSHIVNTASLGGFIAGPGVGIYSATKAAVVALSETLHWEMLIGGDKVGVTILAPGPVRTGIYSGSRNRPAGRADSGMADVDVDTDPLFVDADWVGPDVAGEVVMAAIQRGALYATTHPAMVDLIEARMSNVANGLRVRFVDCTVSAE